MISKPRQLRRIQTAMAALGLLSATIVPSLLGQVAYAFPTGAQVLNRKITMSSSKLSDTGVSYEVSFNLGSAHTVKGIVVDFCAGSPIVGDSTCVKPTAFNIPASPTVTLQAGISGGTWVSGATAINTNRTLKINDATGNALAAGANVKFTITGVTNTSTLGTFYARIVTYNDQTAVTSNYATYSPGSEGSATAIDYGGVALSTANQLDVTAKVQEQLTFCVYTTGATCAGALGTSVPLGDTNGVLAAFNANYTNTAKFNVGSNAANGVVINLKGENLCRVTSPCTDTDNGNIIDRQGDTCTVDSTSTSIEQFGARVSTFGAGVSSVTYNCAASSHRFNRTNTTSTYGDVLASTAGPGDEVQSTIELAAKAATTTQAGIYTTTLSMIATGTY